MELLLSLPRLNFCKNMNFTIPKANRIDKSVKQNFARDPMMQKLHQIRRDLARNKTLVQILKAINKQVGK